MSTFFNPGGSNPRYGRDHGPRPPASNGYGAGFPGMQGGIPAMGMPGAYPSMPGMVPAAPGFGYQPYSGVTSAPGAGTYGAHVNSQGQPQYYGYSSGHFGGGRHPQAHPVVNPSLPAAHLTNSTGGIGCEPGYNYFFPQEHTKIHVLKSGKTAPWQLPPNFTIPFHACHVPVNTAVGDLLKGFGATNASSKKNVLYEVVQGGNGRWYRGLTFWGNEKANMKLTLKELGWDKSRSGLPGGKPVVYLYITKD